MKVSVFYLHTLVFCKTTQERIVGGTVIETNFLGQLGHAGKGRAVGAFVFGVPSIVAVVINYLKGRKQKGLPKSHFAGRFDVVAFAALVHCRRDAVHYNLAALLPLIVLIAAAVWAIYRIARGWLALRDRRPMYTSGGVRI